MGIFVKFEFISSYLNVYLMIKNVSNIFSPLGLLQLLIQLRGRVDWKTDIYT